MNLLRSATRVLAFAAPAALSLALAAPAAVAQTTLKFASLSPANSRFNQEILAPMIAKLEKDSGGELKIEFFPGGTLGRAPDAQLRLVKTGVADIAWVIPYYTPGEFPDNDVFEVPLLVRNGIEGSLAITRMLQGGHLRGYDDLKVIALLVQPPNVLHSTFPVKEPADLKGRKIRSAGSIQQYTLEAVGATPVGGLTGPQVAENISRGLVEGGFADWAATVSFRIHSVTNYHYDLPVGATAAMVAMNKAKYQSLSAKAREAIDRNSGEASALTMSRLFDKIVRENQAMVAADRKQTVKNMTPEEEAKWIAAFKPGVQEWLKSDPLHPKLLSTATATLEAIRKNPPQ